MDFFGTRRQIRLQATIVVHHSGNRGRKDPTEIEAFHMDTRGWPDVGYHYFIHPNGTFYEGRSILHKGSHVLKPEAVRCLTRVGAATDDAADACQH